MSVTEVAPDLHVGIGDRSLLDVYFGSEVDGILSLITHQRRPVDMAPSLAYHELIGQEAAEREIDFHTEVTYAATLGYTGPLDKFETIAHGLNLLKFLGYSWSQGIQEGRDVEDRWIQFTYPTFATLNSRLDVISPDEGLRFTSHPDKYNAEELALALENGLGLIAENRAYQAHDHLVLHVLGGIGLHGGYLERTQDYMRAYYARSQAESDLPPVPHIEDPSIASFLTPAHRALTTFARGFDITTNAVAVKYFRNRENTQPFRPLLAGSLEYIINNGINTNVPSVVVDDLDQAKLFEYAEATEKRYDELDRRAAELLAA